MVVIACGGWIGRGYLIDAARQPLEHAHRVYLEQAAGDVANKLDAAAATLIQAKQALEQGEVPPPPKNGICHFIWDDGGKIIPNIASLSACPSRTVKEAQSYAPLLKVKSEVLAPLNNGHVMILFRVKSAQTPARAIGSIISVHGMMRAAPPSLTMHLVETTAAVQPGHSLVPVSTRSAHLPPGALAWSMIAPVPMPWYVTFPWFLSGLGLLMGLWMGGVVLWQQRKKRGGINNVLLHMLSQETLYAVLTPDGMIKDPSLAAHSFFTSLGLDEPIFPLTTLFPDITTPVADFLTEQAPHYTGGVYGHPDIQILMKVAPFFSQRRNEIYVVFQDVSDIFTLNQRLEDFKGYYAKVSAHQKELVYRHNRQGDLLFANKSFCESFNLDHAAIEGASLANLLPVDTFETLQQLKSHLMPESPYGDLEYFIYTHEGERIWFESEITAFYTPQGSVQEYQSIDKNITAQKKIEDELSKAKARMGDLISSSPAVLFTADISPPYPITYMSDNVRYLFGYKPSDFLDAQNFWLTKVHPEHAPLVMEDFPKLFANGQHTFQYKFQDRSGVYRWIESVMRIVSHGGELKIVGYWIDITRRKEAEQAIFAAQSAAHRASRELDYLFSLSADPMCLINSQGKFTRLNPAWTKYGYDLKNLENTVFFDLIHPDDVGLAQEDFQMLLSGGNSIITPHMLRFRDSQGDYHWFAWGTFIDARKTLIYAVAHDMTTLKRQEVELRDAKEAAQNASIAKSRFLATMSHEIRTPMNSLLGYIKLLRATPLNHVQTDYTSIVYEAGQALLNIINDVLDYSKMEAGKFRLETTTFDLKPVIESVCKLMLPTAEQKEISLIYTGDEAVPQALVGDPARLRQILINLVGNALKFTEYGSVHINTKVLDHLSDKVVLHIEVIDTGIGISQEDQHSIFEEFSQANTSASNRQYGGTGLGLAICRQLVELMQGTMGLASVEQQGSTFWFTLSLPIGNPEDLPKQSLPIQDHARPPGLAAFATVAQAVRTQHHDEEGIFEAESTTALLPPEGTKGTLLLVEDNIHNQHLATTVLRSYGFKVDVASNGKEAVHMVQDGAYDVVLMDIHMPVMNGYIATRTIRSLGVPKADIPIIALTAFTLPEDRQRAHDAGMDDFATKPLDFDVLLSMIDHWRGQRSSYIPGTPVPQESADAPPPEAALKGGDAEVAFSPSPLPSPLPSSLAHMSFTDDNESESPTLTHSIEKENPMSKDYTSNHLPIFKDEALNQLRSLIPAESLLEILNNFLADIPDREQRMLTAWQHQEMEPLKLEAHALRALAGNMGALRLSEMAQDLQSAARHQDKAIIDVVMGNLTATVQETLRNVAAYKETF